MENEYVNERRMLYTRVNETIRYASGSNVNGDADGEAMALKHACELILELLEGSALIVEVGAREGGGDAVELDGVREVQGAPEDIQEAGDAPEEGAPQAHVVPVVPGGDAAPGEVLTMTPDPPLESAHGLTGINPKRGVPPRTFRLYSLDAEGNDAGLVDTGTAAELAKRNHIGPSTVYKLAGKPGAPGRK